MSRAAAPLVSVYITNHNYGRFIGQSVDSVLQQTMLDYELIIIDDGSSDDSRTVIERYSHLPGVRIIHQECKGLNITNNIALRVARGKYLMRLDADDWLEKNALLLMTNALEQDSELGLVFPDYYLVDAAGDVLGLERRHSFDKDVSLLDQPAHGACTMIRREFLLALGGYDESFTCQDGYDLWLKFIDRHKVENINLPLFYYRQHGNNLTRNEERILSTRSEIKRVHVERENKQLSAIGVVAVRGTSVDPSSIAMDMLGDERIVDRLIRAALDAKSLTQVIVTSSDAAVAEHVKSRWGKSERLRWLDRPDKISRLNVGIHDTLQHVLAHCRENEGPPDVMAVVSQNYPLIRGRLLDDAVHTMALFDVDKVISVRPETAMFYQHDGHGLHMILDQARFTRLEREALYRSAGGITAFRTASLRTPPESLRIGHIVVDQRSSHGIYSAFDMEVASLLASSVMDPKKSTSFVIG